MNRPVRVGVIGAGNIVQRLHLPTLRQLENVELTALAEANPERLRECVATFGFARGHTDYRAMLDQGGLDAVLVAAPNVLHAPATIAALEAGCHVLVEKPMATSGADAQRMADVARARGRTLTINLPRRFSGHYRAARALLDEGAAGRIYAAHAAIVRRSGIPGYGSWFTTAALSGGGALLDVGVHILDVALWLLDEPRVLAVSATVGDRLGRAGRGLGRWGIDRGAIGTFDVEDSVNAQLRCADGLSITLEVCWAAYAPIVHGVRLLGTEGGIVVDERRHLGGSVELHTDSSRGPTITQPEVSPESPPAGQQPLRGFIDSIRTGAPPPVPAAAGVRLARLCDAIYASARTAREVRLDESDAETGGMNA